MTMSSLVVLSVLIFLMLTCFILWLMLFLSWAASLLFLCLSVCLS